MPVRHLVAPLLLLLLAVPASAPARAEEGRHRTWSTEAGAWVETDAMLASLATADVVFVGEIHDHAAAHALELALLQGLYRLRPALAVGFEMFERDVQPVLDGYVGGSVPEADFLARTRPWSNYATDYRPLVEFARAHGLPALATNAPRTLAAQVATKGLEALDALPPHVRRFLARRVSAPVDAYYERFAGQAAAHPHGEPGAVLRYYRSQCLKDDTMAETVADHLETAANRAPLVIHFNGAFHTDYGLGTAARTRSRVPAARVAVVSLVPAEDLDRVDPAEDAGLAEFVIYYPKPEEKPEAPAPGP